MHETPPLTAYIHYMLRNGQRHWPVLCRLALWKQYLNPADVLRGWTGGVIAFVHMCLWVWRSRCS